MATQQKDKIYRAEDVAKYLIYLGSEVVGDRGEIEGVTNLKLQKLLYLAQAYYVSKLGRPLFKDKIEAWKFGPVVPSVYKKFSAMGNKPILNEKDDTNLLEADKEQLKEIWDAFGGFSAGRLVEITHGHTPWRDAYEARDRTITNEALAKYYAPLLSE